MTAAKIRTARARLTRFLAALPRRRRLLIFHDWDADGITSAVILWSALRRLGYVDVLRAFPDRERNAWTLANRQRIEAAACDALFVLDLGVRDQPLASHLPTCFIDHHRPEGLPRENVVISSYDWDPIPNTSLLVWELCRTLAPIKDLEWVAALGAWSDLGAHAPFSILKRARTRYGSSWLSAATALVNAPRRIPEGDPAAASRALLRHPNPRAFVEADDADAASMRRARAQAGAAMSRAKRAAPKFSGEVALIEIDSPCQIHPLVAQIWRARLPKHYVIVANYGYLPGRINFAARGPADKSVLRFLRGIDVGEGEGSYASGHDQASGGSLPAERWRRLLNALGFGNQR